MLGNLLKTDAEGILLFFPVLRNRLLVRLRRNADDRLQRLDDFFLRNPFRLRHDRSHLDTAGGLHDYVHSRMDVQLARFKIIYLARIPKADSYYFYHISSSPLLSATAVPL